MIIHHVGLILITKQESLAYLEMDLVEGVFCIQVGAPRKNDDQHKATGSQKLQFWSIVHTVKQATCERIIRRHSKCNWIAISIRDELASELFVAIQNAIGLQFRYVGHGP
jgi:hypothetical protein